jgi:hypothetical protein
VCARRGLAGLLACAVVFAGCASAPAGREATALVADAPRANQCDEAARSIAGPGSWAYVAGYGALSMVLGAVWGAADGASWGLVRGIDAAQAAWIGAAAGAGIGLVIGLMAGAAKGREAPALYRSAYHACLAGGAPGSEKTAAAANAGEPDGVTWSESER